MKFKQIKDKVKYIAQRVVAWTFIAAITLLIMSFIVGVVKIAWYGIN